MGDIMSFDIYQEKTGETAIYPPEKALEYLTLGLCSEAGEVAGKLKKIIRDNNGVIDEDAAQKLSLEIGDVLWYVAQLATTLGLQLSEVAEDNLSKLASRKNKGTITGSGDYR
jgi:NTP pyrophosphatase (non-canonical NTP hydrolase)